MDNKRLIGDNVEHMKQLPDASVDFCCFSPPYDNIRTYNGFTHDLHKVGEQCFRLLKDGGMVAMVIQDQTKDFGKSLTSFRTTLDWCDTIGFKLFECCIYERKGVEGAWWSKRFRVDHEYILLFLKGDRPAFFNKQPLKVPCKHPGVSWGKSTKRMTDGTTKRVSKEIVTGTHKCRGTIWEYNTCGDGSKLKKQHPATYPNRLAYDLVQCFCPIDGVVIDPYVGSGTTCVAAKSLGRNYIGIDISKEYCEITEKRLNEETLKYA